MPRDSHPGHSSPRCSTGLVHHLTASDAQFRSPEWSPDGRSLTIVKALYTPAQEVDIVTRDAAGRWGAPRTLVKAGANGHAPAHGQVRRPLPAVAPFRLPGARQPVLLHRRRSAERCLDDGGDGRTVTNSASRQDRLVAAVLTLQRRVRRRFRVGRAFPRSDSEPSRSAGAGSDVPRISPWRKTAGRAERALVPARS
jgi:hypothetical protein